MTNNQRNMSNNNDDFVVIMNNEPENIVEPSPVCIEHSVLEIHCSELPLPFQIVGEDEDFGLLKVKMSKAPITTVPVFFLFTVDKTGSMNENAYGNQTKMMVVIQTMINVFLYLAKQDATIYVQVNSFNAAIDVTIDRVQITLHNVDALIEQIRNLCASNITNIEAALTRANEVLGAYSRSFPDHQICHMFMTDGQPTMGEKRSDLLSALVHEEYSHIFIGFGQDHNARLLKCLSDRPSCLYQYVNSMEHTSLIYGEAIHRYLFPCIRNAYLIVDEGEIYDWMTNTWTNRINEDVLVSEIEKMYHIRRKKGNCVAVDIYGIYEGQNEPVHIENSMEIPYLIDLETGDKIEMNLIPYMFRQKTQELLFQTKNADIDRSELKAELLSFFKIMRNYMKENNLLLDPFMKMLCDDIHITYTTIGSEEGEMYALARYTSQGRQQSYSATPRRADTSDSPPRAPRKMTRDERMGSALPLYEMDQTTLDFGGEVSNDLDEDEEISTYVVNMETVHGYYTTSSAMDTMTQISMP